MDYIFISSRPFRSRALDFSLIDSPALLPTTLTEIASRETKAARDYGSPSYYCISGRPDAQHRVIPAARGEPRRRYCGSRVTSLNLRSYNSNRHPNGFNRLWMSLVRPVSRFRDSFSFLLEEIRPNKETAERFYPRFWRRTTHRN